MAKPATIRIEVSTRGNSEVWLGEPRNEREVQRLLVFYRAMRPHIDVLKEAARRESNPKPSSPTRLPSG
jgi:hypothetical protein